MKFLIPGTEPPPVVISRPLRVILPDEDAPLPDNILECDELIEQYWEAGDVANYHRVALHCNQLCGWERWDTVQLPKKFKLFQHGK